MNRREMLKGIAGVAVGAGAVAVTGATPQSKPFIRMRSGDVGSERVRVFLDGVDITRDCHGVDTSRGEVKLLVRPVQVTDGKVHFIFRTGAVRVELDGKVYTS